jgi:replicative DNA helicase
LEGNLQIIPECVILNILLVKKNYIKYNNNINRNSIRNSYKDLNNIYSVLDILHDKFNKEEYSLDELESFFYTQYPNMKSVEREVYTSLFGQLRSTNVSEDIAHDLVTQITARSLASKIALQAFDVSEGKGSAGDLDLLLKQWSDESNKPSNSLEPEFVNDDLEYLYSTAVGTPGLRWRTDSLNKRLGSLRKGDFGFIFARPERGKTTFLASEVTHMATQTDAPILWINNEEQGSKVMLRCHQAALGKDLAELFSDIPGSKRRFGELCGSRIKVFDDAGASKSRVENLCSVVKPGLLIFDQIDKIKGFDADREDLRLGSIYIWARELAKTYCPVIGVCQADGTGEGVKWLTMSHVANAKTSKQAEADWILGIGQQNIEGFEYVRHLHLSKNKLIGDEDTVPSLRHDRWDVIISPETARFRDE